MNIPDRLTIVEERQLFNARLLEQIDLRLRKVEFTVWKAVGIIGAIQLLLHSIK
jgi:hypothetical protein